MRASFDRKPNFFVIGAPKAGTTAMCEYLRYHPRVYVSHPKETFFWAIDMPGLRGQLGIDTLTDYEDLFAAAPSQCTAIGEGSTLYLASSVAVTRILRYNPSAKFIVMLRHPVALIHSFYNQVCRTLNEDCETFEEAWQLQEERATGSRIPKACADPRLLQYRRIASLGSQLQRVYEQVPPERLKVLFHEDLCESPRDTYLETLEFLGLEDEGRESFEHYNTPARYRSKALGHLYENRAVRQLLNACKRGLPGSLVQRLQHVKDLAITKPVNKTPLSAQTYNDLLGEFRHEIRLIARLTARDLSHWLEEKSCSIDERETSKGDVPC